MEKDDIVMEQDHVEEVKSEDVNAEEVKDEQATTEQDTTAEAETEDTVEEDTEYTEDKQYSNIDMKILGEKLGQFFGKQVSEFKKVGEFVEGAGKDCFRQFEKEYDEYMEKAKVKGDKTKKKVTLEKLYNEVGKIAYDGYKSGEDVDAVLKYFYKKIEKLEEDAEVKEEQEEKAE